MPAAAARLVLQMREQAPGRYMASEPPGGEAEAKPPIVQDLPWPLKPVKPRYFPLTCADVGAAATREGRGRGKERGHPNKFAAIRKGCGNSRREWELL